MRRPNVLLIYTDQQRWDAIGANGNTDIRTPVIDQLAADGVNFDHCFVQNPVCMPSRVSLLTGQYPSALGITHMGVPVPEGTATMPRILGSHGYVTGNIGKLHFLPHANRDHRDHHPSYGFDHLELSEEPGCYEDAYRAWVRRKAPDQLDNISLGLPQMAQTWRDAMGIEDTIIHPETRLASKGVPFGAPSDLTHGAFVAEQTAEFIRTHRDRPFLAVASFYSPHSPWVAPQEYLDLYDPASLSIPTFPPDVDEQRSDGRFGDDELRAVRHGYYAMVSEVDAHIGVLLECLAENGLADDTIVVLVSDHGEWLGEHLNYGKGYPGHDAVARVPLVMRFPPELSPRGHTVSSIVEAVDVLPTLLEACGVGVPSHVQGRSLLPLANGDIGHERDSALMEFTGWRTMRTHQYRYVCHDDGTESLFDLAREFGEYTDVSAEPAYATDLADLRHHLLQRLISAEQPLPKTWAY